MAQNFEAENFDGPASFKYLSGMHINQNKASIKFLPINISPRNAITV